MNKADLLTRIDALVAQGQAVIASIPKPPADRTYYVEEYAWVNLELAAAYRTAGISLLYGMYGKNAQPAKDFNTFTDGKKTVTNYKQAHGVVKAVRAEVDNDWYYSTRALISASVFSDFIEMAEYLLSEGYKDAAAVLVGGALEGHLRTLATPRGIPLDTTNAKTGKQEPRKADSLNQELYGNNAYDKTDNKNVTAWLGLRNDAAHGHYGNYTADQVDVVLKGVRDFLKRVPA